MSYPQTYLATKFPPSEHLGESQAYQTNIL